MSTINKVTGKKYRILKDAVNKVWDEISFQSVASDTLFNDGMDAETKLGAIKGIVTTEQTDPGYVLDASVTALAPKIFNGTLRPGSPTTLTFIDPVITDTAKIQIYTNLYGYIPDSVNVSGNTLTIEFSEPDSLVLVKVEVSEFHN